MTLTVQDLDDVELEARIAYEKWEIELLKNFYEPQLRRLALIAFASAPQEVVDMLDDETLLQVNDLMGGTNGI